MANKKEERNKEIIKRAKRGENHTEIAAFFRITRARVSAIALAAGVRRRPPVD